MNYFSMDTHNHEKLDNIMEFQAKICHCAKVIPYLKGILYPCISLPNKREILHLFFWDWRHKRHKIPLLRVGVTLRLLHMFRFMIMFTHVLEWVKPMSAKHSQNVKWECGFTLRVKHLNILFSSYLKAPPCLEDAFVNWKDIPSFAWKPIFCGYLIFQRIINFGFFNNLKVENHQLQFFEK